VKRTMDHKKNAMGVKRRFAILSMAACVLLSGCGVRSGMERIDEAKDAKKQVEKQRHKIEKELRKGQENLEEGQ
jgi:outer membrane biogenesis lipoprotein LolB